MSKQKVIIADSDAEYVFPLEAKFLEEIDGLIDLEVITDRDYFERFFSRSVSAEILIISEKWFSSGISAHDISNIFILTEQSSGINRDKGNIHYIYKYTSLKLIYHQVVFSMPDDDRSESVSEKHTEVVAVYSASGGSGKTSVSLGLAACLTKNYKKVLFVDAEYLQNAHYYFSSQSAIPADVIRKISKNDDGRIYNSLLPYIRNEKFDYLTPLCSSLYELGLDYSFFIRFIGQAKASGKYDYIIVDTDCIYDQGKEKLLDLADRTVMVMRQDPYSVMKTDMFLSTADAGRSSMLYVCNAFRSDRRDAILENKSRYLIDEYIERIGSGEDISLEELEKADGIWKLSFRLM